MKRSHLIFLTISCAAVLAAPGSDRLQADEHVAMQPIRFARIPPEPIPLPPVDGQSHDQLMTLTEAESMALAYHPAMREAEGLVRAARGEWLQVGLRPNPAVGYDGTDIGDDNTAGKQSGFL